MPLLFQFSALHLRPIDGCLDLIRGHIGVALLQSLAQSLDTSAQLLKLSRRFDRSRFNGARPLEKVGAHFLRHTLRALRRE
jgi:hypothetical protein